MRSRTLSRGRAFLLAWTLLVSVAALGRLAEVFAPAPSWPPIERIDLRTAPLFELTLLPGIGETRAEAIVLDRVRQGPIETLEDLLRVDGVGPTTLERIESFVIPGGPLGGSEGAAGRGKSEHRDP
ncbi:MAG: helix-hairpin-helix domain-containing protein [Planctomycetota bacterium]